MITIATDTEHQMESIGIHHHNRRLKKFKVITAVFVVASVISIGGAVGYLVHQKNQHRNQIQKQQEEVTKLQELLKQMKQERDEARKRHGDRRDSSRRDEGRFSQHPDQTDSMQQQQAGAWGSRVNNPQRGRHEREGLWQQRHQMNPQSIRTGVVPGFAEQLGHRSYPGSENQVERRERPIEARGQVPRSNVNAFGVVPGMAQKDW